MLDEKSMRAKTTREIAVDIDPIHKDVTIFLSCTNMNKMNSLHHVKQHPKISSLL